MGRRRRSARGRRAGFTLIEVAISSVVIALLMMGSTSAFIGSLRGVDEARRTGEAAVFLETTLENVGAQPYDNLLSMNGDRILSGETDERSEYALDLAVFQNQVDLIQVSAVLVDLRQEREMARTAILRSRR